MNIGRRWLPVWLGVMFFVVQLLMNEKAYNKNRIYLEKLRSWGLHICICFLYALSIDCINCYTMSRFINPHFFWDTLYSKYWINIYKRRQYQLLPNFNFRVSHQKNAWLGFIGLFFSHLIFMKFSNNIRHHERVPKSFYSYEPLWTLWHHIRRNQSLKILKINIKKISSITFTNRF